MVRPKMRQKASTTHLKILRQRKDVSTEISSPTHDDPSAVDPNTYSTYMGMSLLIIYCKYGTRESLDLYVGMAHIHGDT